MTQVENVLVLCSRNSARSQMAEALLRKHAGHRFQVFSAGLEAAEIHPLAAKVMEEIGLPLTGHRSKSAREFLGKLPVHHLIVVCAETERECPKLFPGAVHFYSWPVPDPVGAKGSPATKLDEFRNVRDEIEDRVIAWLRDPDTGLVTGRT